MTITVTEDYAQLLAGLAAACSRGERARLLDAITAQADQTAAGFFGHGIEDQASDPLAWTETATQLARLAAAERGLILQPAAPEDRDPTGAWADLAAASSPAEYEAAFAVIRKQLAGTIRATAIARVAAAAQACAAARGQTAPGA